MSKPQPIHDALPGNAKYDAGFLTSREADDLFQWIEANSGVREPREITLADGTIHRCAVGKLMFVDPPLVDTDLFPAEHGARMSWPAPVLALRDRIEIRAGVVFAVCVCLYYPDGSAGVGFHSDLPAFGPTFRIASVSLGARREFQIRDRRDPTRIYAMELDHGSLLLMGDGFQERFEHALTIDERITNARTNLTFRCFSWGAGVDRASRV